MPATHREIADFSEIAGNNPELFPEGQPANTVNDAARELLSALARHNADTNGSKEFRQASEVSRRYDFTSSRVLPNALASGGQPVAGWVFTGRVAAASLNRQTVRILSRNTVSRWTDRPIYNAQGNRVVANEIPAGAIISLTWTAELAGFSIIGITGGGGDLSSPQNLSDVEDAEAALDNLGGLAIADNLDDLEDRETALDNLQVSGVHIISNQTNCNTLISRGEYRLEGSAPNTPGNANGLLVVQERNDFIRQTYHVELPSVAGGHNLYVRVSENNGSSWGPWRPDGIERVDITGAVVENIRETFFTAFNFYRGSKNLTAGKAIFSHIYLSSGLGSLYVPVLSGNQSLVIAGALRHDSDDTRDGNTYITLEENRLTFSNSRSSTFITGLEIHGFRRI